MAEICDQNFDVLCRLCLNHIDGDFVPIFDIDPIYHAVTVKDKIFFTTAILASPEDRLPGQICGMCDDRVNDCYAFKQESIVNNVKLRTYLQQQDDADEARSPPVVGSPARINKRFHSSDSEQLQLGSAGQHPRNPNSPPLPNGNHAATGPPTAVASPARKRKRLESATEDELCESVCSPSKEMSEVLATRVAAMRAGKATKRDSEITSQEVALPEKGPSFLLSPALNGEVEVKAEANSEVEVKTEANGEVEVKAEANGNNEKDPTAKVKKSRVLWTMRTRGKAQKRVLAMGHRLRPSRHEESEAAADDDIFRYLRLNDVSQVASLKLASEANEAARAAEIAPVGKERKCPECGERFATLPELRDHRKATGHTMPKCEVCGKTFLSREVRDNHTLKKHRRGAERPEQVKKTKERRCHECGVVFESLPDLRSHQNEAGHRLAPVCKICGIIYKSFEAREKHVLKRHKGKADNTGKIRFLCNVCNKNFKTKAHLASHLTQHAKAGVGVQNYACELCDERFFNTAELRVHFEAKHDSDTQLFQCLFCDATLASSKALRSHFNRVHKPGGVGGGELKYTCATCLQRFDTKATLNAHIRTHKMERLELDPLRLHKLFECEVCGESFKHNSTKKNHVLKCHASEEEDDRKVKAVKKVQADLQMNTKKIKRHSYAGVPDL